MIDTSSLDKVWEYIEELEQWWRQARERVVELVDEVNELKEENKELKAKINRVIDLFKRWDSSDLYDYIDDLDYEEN